MEVEPENDSGLQEKEDDCGVFIPYMLVASPQGWRKRSCHMDPGSSSHQSTMTMMSSTWMQHLGAEIMLLPLKTQRRWFICFSHA